MRGIAFSGERLGSYVAYPSSCRPCGVRLLELSLSDSTRRVEPSITRSIATIQQTPKRNGRSNAPEFKNAQRRFISRTSSFGGDVSPISVMEPGSNRHEKAQNTPSWDTLKSSFYAIIQRGQPDQVMNALLDPVFYGVVAWLPQSTFIEVLHMLSPAYFVEPYREIHRAIHPYAVVVKGLKPLELVFKNFAHNLSDIIKARRRSGHTLGLAEYTHVLDCARSMGDAPMAERIWFEMEQDGIEPDIHCYNSYIEAHVWHSAYTGGEKYHLRMSPFAYRRRRFGDPNLDWKGYGTAGRSVRKEVLQIFRRMVQDDIPGDETTFVNIFLASSRVGHVTGMKEVLKAVWNIDADLLGQDANMSEHPPVAEYERSSPLHPTERLLFAIVHGFGTNNDVYVALRAMDLVSRSYNVAVPQRVWYELIERAFQLSRPRYGPRAEQDLRGRVPLSFVTRLFNMMTSEPYNVRPTLNIYRMVAKIAWDNSKASRFEQYTVAAYELLKETRRKRNAARDAIGRYLDQISVRSIENAKDNDNDNDNDNNENENENHGSSLLHSRALADAINVYDVYRTITTQQTILLERQVILLLKRKWARRKDTSWQRQQIPRIIGEWQDFLPRLFTYDITSGTVEFRLFQVEDGSAAERIRIPVRRVVAAGVDRIGNGDGGCFVNDGFVDDGEGEGGQGDTIVEQQQQQEQEQRLEQQIIDDDFFWDDYIEASSGKLDFSKPPLDRLNWAPFRPTWLAADYHNDSVMDW